MVQGPAHVAYNRMYALVQVWQALMCTQTHKVLRDAVKDDGLTDADLNAESTAPVDIANSTNTADTSAHAQVSARTRCHLT